MSTELWKQYYAGMFDRTFLRPVKIPEIIERCGGLLLKETDDEAIKRLAVEIKTVKDSEVIASRL